MAGTRQLWLDPRSHRVIFSPYFHFFALLFSAFSSENDADPTEGPLRPWYGTSSVSSLCTEHSVLSEQAHLERVSSDAKLIQGHETVSVPSRSTEHGLLHAADAPA